MQNVSEPTPAQWSILGIVCALLALMLAPPFAAFLLMAYGG